VAKGSTDPLIAVRRRIIELRRKATQRLGQRSRARVLMFSRQPDRRRTDTTPIPAGLFLVDRNGICLYVNAEYQFLVGVENFDACLGRGWLERVAEGYELVAAREWLTAIRSGDPFTIRTRILHGNSGQVVPVVVRAAPLSTARGEVIGYSAVMALDQSGIEVSRDAWKERLVSLMLMACALMVPGCAPAATDVPGPHATTEIPVWLTADELYNAYDDNEVQADRVRKDRRIVLTGRIRDIGKDIAGRAYVTFHVARPGGHVQALFTTADDVAALRKDTDVKAECTVSGYLAGVLLRGCVRRP